MQTVNHGHNPKFARLLVKRSTGQDETTFYGEGCDRKANAALCAIINAPHDHVEITITFSKKEINVYEEPNDDADAFDDSLHTGDPSFMPDGEDFFNGS